MDAHETQIEDLNAFRIGLNHRFLQSKIQPRISDAVGIRRSCICFFSDHSFVAIEIPVLIVRVQFFWVLAMEEKAKAEEMTRVERGEFSRDYCAFGSIIRRNTVAAQPSLSLVTVSAPQNSLE